MKLSLLILTWYLLGIACYAASWPEGKSLTRVFYSEHKQAVRGPHERVPRTSRIKEEQTVQLDTAGKKRAQDAVPVRLTFPAIRLEIHHENSEPLRLDSRRVEDRVHPAMQGWRAIKDVELFYLSETNRWRFLKSIGSAVKLPEAATRAENFHMFLEPSILQNRPSVELKPGMRWTAVKDTVRLGEGKKVIQLAYTVEGKEVLHGFEVLKISVEGSIPDEDSADVTMRVDAFQLKGQVWYSPDWKIDIAYRMTQELKYEQPHPQVEGVIRGETSLQFGMTWGGIRDRSNSLLTEPSTR